MYIFALVGAANNALVLETGVRLLPFLSWVMPLDFRPAHGIRSQQFFVEIEKVCEVLFVWDLPFWYRIWGF